jgi:hypothetical protein
MGDERTPLDHGEIAKRAYSHWEAEGRPTGKAEAHWHDAVRELGRERSEAVGTLTTEGDLHLRTGPEVTNTDRALPPSERRRVRRERQNAATGATSSGPAAHTNHGPAPHFVVTLDRAHLRIYRASETTGPSTWQLQIEHSLDLPSGRESYTARDTDQAGRFASPHGGPPGGSIDERLPMQLESNRRIAGELAAAVESFLQQHPGATWDFAAGPALHHSVLNNLSPATRRRLEVAVSKDLVNQSLDSWREHFARDPLDRNRGRMGGAHAST